MITKVYIDLDGVIANFDKRWTELFQEAPRTSFNSDNWESFVRTRQFESLELIGGSKEFLKSIEELSEYFKFNIYILTSGGGHENWTDVAKQKIKWLEYHEIEYRPFVVHSKKYKKNYADYSSLLIDDHPSNVLQFQESGGYSIIHLNHQISLDSLSEVLQGAN